MKKMLFLAIALVVSVQAMGQGNDPVYIVFTPTTEDVQGIDKFVIEDYNRELYNRTPVHFAIFSRPAGYFFRFVDLSWKEDPEDPWLLRSVDFLDTVEYIDWDEIGPTLTKDQASELIAEILAHETIYFIEKPKSRAILDPKLKLTLISAGPLRSRY